MLRAAISRLFRDLSARTYKCGIGLIRRTELPEVAQELYTGMKVGFSSLCIDKELTYEFLDDVIRELAALTPGAYIHIGGDEARSTPKDEYKRFVERTEKIVKAHGKEAVCWEEAAQCELSSDVILQYWTDIKHAEMAAEKGMQVIMSPAP